MGDQHTCRAALPGTVQRASAQVCHGRRLPGQTGELSRENVSTDGERNLAKTILDHHL